MIQIFFIGSFLGLGIALFGFGCHEMLSEPQPVMFLLLAMAGAGITAVNTSLLLKRATIYIVFLYQTRNETKKWMQSQ